MDQHADIPRSTSMEQLAMEWARAQPSVRAFIGSLVRDWDTAEELLQRTAAAAVTKAGSYDASRPFIAWAIGLARIEVLRHQETAARHRSVFSQEAIAAVGTAYTEAALESRELLAALAECMKGLQDRARQVLELRHIRNLHAEHIAAELRMSVGAVYTTLHRTRVSLRRCVEHRMQAGRGSA